MTLIARDQMRPGQIVARVTYYRVKAAKWDSGKYQIEECVERSTEWQLVRGRWRVRWRPPFGMLGAHFGGFWIAEEQDRRDEDGDHEWRAFDTWAEAIAYADRMARQACT